MNDDFLTKFRKPPRPEFAAALYQRISKPMDAQSKIPFLKRLSKQLRDDLPRTLATKPKSQHVWWRRKLMIGISGGLSVLLMAMIFFPGGPVAAAQSIQETVSSIVLGAYSTAQRVEAFMNGEPVPDDKWSIGVFPDTDADVLSVSSVDEAQQLTMFQIHIPTYLPEGYVLEDIKLAPFINGSRSVVHDEAGVYLIFNKAGSMIVIVQQSVGSNRSVGFSTNGTLEEVDLNGRTAAWADGHLLMWEADGISYLVGGPDLVIEEAIKIANSLGD
jgi:hypothetical protein